MSTTPDSHPLAGRPVLVTGAGGFIGGHLTARLVEEGARVRAYLRHNSRNERGWLDELDPSIQREIDAVFGDLRDIESTVSMGVYVLEPEALEHIPDGQPFAGARAAQGRQAHWLLSL